MPVAHHNRTLVLNNNKQPPAAAAASSAATTSTALASAPATATATGSATSFGNLQTSAPTAAVTNTTTTGWVAKRDRHMQLINTAVYEKQAQARTKAIAKTAEDKLRRREAHDKTKINRFLHSQGSREVEIAGERFQVTAGGSKLVRVSGEDRIIHLLLCPFKPPERGEGVDVARVGLDSVNMFRKYECRHNSKEGNGRWRSVSEKPQRKSFADRLNPRVSVSHHQLRHTRYMSASAIETFECFRTNIPETVH